ncbi:MAG: transposase [Phaeodactylibacter sp.]|nr:transposase [Phaeodactylibacter sp.]
MHKRIHIKRAAYLITTNCKGRFPFFEEDILCNILIDAIESCRKMKSFELIAFKINPDHSHVLLQPTGKFNISQILQNIKRTSSNHINQIIHFFQAENQYKKLNWTESLQQYNLMFIRKYNFRGIHEFPKFQWQEGFDDQLVRTQEELEIKINYIKKQALKHELKEDKFLFVTETIPSDIVFIGQRK